MQNKDLKRCGQKQNKKILEQFQKGAQKGGKKKGQDKKEAQTNSHFFQKNGHKIQTKEREKIRRNQTKQQLVVKISIIRVKKKCQKMPKKR